MHLLRSYLWSSLVLPLNRFNFDSGVYEVSQLLKSQLSLDLVTANPFPTPAAFFFCPGQNRHGSRPAGHNSPVHLSAWAALQRSAGVPVGLREGCAPVCDLWTVSSQLHSSRNHSRARLRRAPKSGEIRGPAMRRRIDEPSDSFSTRCSSRSCESMV